MSQIVEVRLPAFPECWAACGNCGSHGVTVEEMPFVVGDRVQRDDTLLVLETGKVALEIPSPAAGLIVGILVEEGDALQDQQIVMLLEVID